MIYSLIERNMNIPNFTKKIGTFLSSYFDFSMQISHSKGNLFGLILFQIVYSATIVIKSLFLSYLNHWSQILGN